MAIDLLDAYPSLPIEREYEGWITERVLEYFEAVGINVHVFAISQNDEASWPADEVVWMPGKMVGLQMKKVADYHGNAPMTYGQVNWQLDRPTKQFDAICQRPEIFYCLPTFTNRRWRRNSLQHCLFWRPKEDTTRTSRVWYDNAHHKIPVWARHIEKSKRSYRWGNFIERVQNCDLGKKVKREPVRDYLRSLISPGVELTARKRDDETRWTESLLLLNIETE